MSTTFYTDTAAPAGVLRTVLDVAEQQLDRVRRRLRLARDRRALREMSDRMLKDIGISRSEIEAVTRYDFTDPDRRVRG